jgi:hypothetical protein
MILSDQELVHLTKIENLTRTGLKTEGALSTERAARFGEEILNLLKR